MKTKNKNVESALDSLRNLRDKMNLSDDETSSINLELDALDEMIDKLENGSIKIAVFGEVSSGKSSLLNALLDESVFTVGARNGVTTTKGEHAWKVIRKEWQDETHGRLVLVDTPGINEVDGKERTKIAKDTIRDTDMVIFVVKSDLNEIEFDAIKELHALNKPILIAFNKVDIYSTHQREVIFDSIMARLEGLIQKNRIVLTASNPIEREVIIERADGTEQVKVRKPPRIIEELKDQILEILVAEGKEIVALNAAIFASGISDRITQEKIVCRKRIAEEIIEKYMMFKAAAVGLNPVPLLDIGGGVLVDAYMVITISKLYGIEMTLAGSQSLMGSIGTSMLAITGAEIGTNLVASAFKIGTGGIGTIATAVPQAAVGAWGTYMVGKASHVYFQNGGAWGDKGPKKVIQEILASSDKDSILAPIKERIKNKILFRTNKDK